MGSLLEANGMLWVYGILGVLPIVMMLVIATAVAHGRRNRSRQDDDS